MLNRRKWQLSLAIWYFNQVSWYNFAIDVSITWIITGSEVITIIISINVVILKPWYALHASLSFLFYRVHQFSYLIKKEMEGEKKGNCCFCLCILPAFFAEHAISHADGGNERGKKNSYFNIMVKIWNESLTEQWYFP